MRPIFPLLQCQSNLLLIFLWYKTLYKTQKKHMRIPFMLLESCLWGKWLVFSWLFLLQILVFYSNNGTQLLTHKRLMPVEDFQWPFGPFFCNSKYVLPSPRTILKYKHLQATQEETDAGVALLNKIKPNKVTLHYDTTSRSTNDGEWFSLILNFNNGKSFLLRPLFFVYKDGESICRLTLDTMGWLLSAVAFAYSCATTAKDLWKNITHIMNDSASKNLKIKDHVAEKLGSKHIPYHLLCKVML